MIKLLHFSDAHIDIANHGRHDPDTGLPFRVLDFLKALDTIVDAAIAEKVDLVIFSGDAYKDRTPVPTFQREWGKRISRLSQAKIPTLLVVGNHDLSPATGRAHALQEFATLQVPYVRVIDKPQLLQPSDLFGLPLQVIGIPWVSRSSLMAALSEKAEDTENIYDEIATRLNDLVNHYIGRLDPALPTILTAHASIEGAKYGAERSVMLGSDLVLSRGLLKHEKFDYVAMGHIHKAQNLNEDSHPPIIYPGSIEKVDFGEAADDKYFVIAEIERGSTKVFWRKLDGRKIIDCRIELENPINVEGQLEAALPPRETLKDAIVRLVISYPKDMESLIDEQALRFYAEEAFEFHPKRQPHIETRLRISGDTPVGSLQPEELLDMYWKTINVAPDDREPLNQLAVDIIRSSVLGAAVDSSEE